MGRWLNDKLPRVTIPTDEISEAHWQQLLHKGDAHTNLRKKEYADVKRSAEYSDIVEGYQILLNKSSTIQSDSKERLCSYNKRSGVKH